MSKIYIVDGNAFVYRMFYAVPEFATSEGTIVNSVFGMAKFFINLLTYDKPDYLVFTSDSHKPTFRHELYEAYKEHREKMPDNLRSQIKIIDEMLDVMKIKKIVVEGFEADDVIATLATRLSVNKENKVCILTGDKDLYSLVSDNVSIYDPNKKDFFDVAKTTEKFGVVPEKIIDYLAIVGDSADNIPGIAGFGPKKAITLINEIGTIEEIYARLDSNKFDDLPVDSQKIFKGSSLEKLIASRPEAILSKKLATIEKDVELGEFNFDEYTFKKEEILNPDTINFFRKYEFNSLVSGEEKKLKTFNDLNINQIILKDSDDLIKIHDLIKTKKELVIDFSVTSDNIFEANIIGISLFIDEKNVYFINRLLPQDIISDTLIFSFLDEIFKDDEITVIGNDLKKMLEIWELFKANLSGENRSETYVKKEGQLGLF